MDRTSIRRWNQANLMEMKKDAKAAAQGAAANALRALTQTQHYHRYPSSSMTTSHRRSRRHRHHHHHPPHATVSFDDVFSDDESAISTELAIQRGSLRAMHEHNEIRTDDDDDDHRNEEGESDASNSGRPHVEFDLASLDGGGQSMASHTLPPLGSSSPTRKKNKKKKQLKKNGFGKKVGRLFGMRARLGSASPSRSHLKSFESGGAHGFSVSKSTSKEITREAWMCGCCGKIFSSLETAEAHEEQCILDTIAQLGQHANAAVLASSPSRKGTNDIIDDEVSIADKELGAAANSLLAEAGRGKRPTVMATLAEEEDHRRKDSDDALDGEEQVDEEIFHTAKQRYSELENLRIVGYSGARSTSLLSSSSIEQNFDSPQPPPPQQRQARSMTLLSSSSLEVAERQEAHPGYYSDVGGRQRDDSSDAGSEGSYFSDPGLPLTPSRLTDVEQRLTNNQAVALAATAPPSTPSSRVERNRAKLQDVDDLLLSHSMRQQIAKTDQALVSVVHKAAKLTLSPEQMLAEQRLTQLSRDKAYYDLMEARALKRQSQSIADRYRAEGEGVLSKVRNKFVDAYQLIKEGDAVTAGGIKDEYKVKVKEGSPGVVTHNDQTLYVNVMVKNSARVVSYELERLGKLHWQDQDEQHQQQQQQAAGANSSKTGKVKFQFEGFRAMAHGNFIKLAGLALASDFTPRKVAVQLSNDLYRLMVPQLKRRGVAIDTEIEYRVGPYFVLAVNVKKINWLKLIKFTRRDVVRRRNDWRRNQERRDELRSINHTSSATDNTTTLDEDQSLIQREMTVLRRLYKFLMNLRKMSVMEQIAVALACLYHVHWTISLPLCYFFYHVLCPTTMRKYILSTVTDEIFSYVEQRGMEMEIQIQAARRQAAFMLGALREIREDSRELKKKRQETESHEKGNILGPLLGPAIPDDKKPAPDIPEGFEVPENLEFVGLEIELPVGFKRLRWALMSAESAFSKDGVMLGEAKYDNIMFHDWNKHNDAIGCTELPDGVTEDDLIGAERETSYLMPRSAFVAANTATEFNILVAHNDYCFCIKRKTLTPEVPFGSTFVTWTQLVVTNTGNGTCHMVCSTEAEFPNGPPLASRQIKSGMRAGTAEAFVLLSETICKYADEFP